MTIVDHCRYPICIEIRALDGSVLLYYSIVLLAIHISKYSLNVLSETIPCNIDPVELRTEPVPTIRMCSKTCNRKDSQTVWCLGQTPLRSLLRRSLNDFKKSVQTRFLNLNLQFTLLNKICEPGRIIISWLSWNSLSVGLRTNTENEKTKIIQMQIKTRHSNFVIIKNALDV